MDVGIRVTIYIIEFQKLENGNFFFFYLEKMYFYLVKTS